MQEIITNFISNSIEKGHCNHFEFHLLSSKNNDDTKAFPDCMKRFETALTKTLFYEKMQKMMGTDYKYHQKQYKEVIIGNTHYQNYNNEDISIYDVRTNFTDVFENAFLIIGQIKNKLTMLSVPSTKNIYSEQYIRKLIFKVSNRITVNFINGHHKNNKYYQINICYSHDKNVDINSTLYILNKVLTILLN
jgi:hypothetical protein